MPVQLIAMTRINTNADVALEKYLSVVGPLMESAGAKVLSRHELSDSIVGDNQIQFVTLVEYPDATSVKSVFDSEEYKSLEKTKLAAFSMYEVNVLAAQ